MLNVLGNIAGLLKPASEAYFKGKRKRVRIKISKLKDKKSKLMKKVATEKIVKKINILNRKIRESEEFLIQE